MTAAGREPGDRSASSPAAPLLPVLVGPTGSGKTSLAIEVAQGLDLEIVSADSRQVYRRLEIGTAKPTAAERAAVPHHLLDLVEPGETYTAERFGRDAAGAFAEIRARGRAPFLVGGSGLYVRAAEEGLFEGPSADPELRRRLDAEAERDGSDALHARLMAVDPESAARLHPNDRLRVVRALEVLELTGETMTELHRRHRESRPPVHVLRFGLSWPTATLDARIAARVDAMLAGGWGDEVRGMLDAGLSDSPAMTSLGYPEVRAWVEGRLPRNEMTAQVVLATRRFAKRQRTWFRAQKPMTWIELEGEQDFSAAVDRIARAIASAPAGP